MTETASIPFDKALHVADRAAIASLYAAPDEARSHRSDDGLYACGSLQRFESIGSLTEVTPRFRFTREIEHALREALQGKLIETQAQFKVRQHIGEGAGRFELEATWEPGDCGQDRSFKLSRVHFAFGEARAEGEGEGRLQSFTDCGETREFLIAAGEFSKLSHELNALRGTFMLNGRLEDSGAFRGVALCRFDDPAGRVRTAREIESPLGFWEPLHSTFLQIRVVSSESDRIGIAPGANGAARLTADSPARSVRFVTKCHGHRGLRSQIVSGPAIGSVASCIEVRRASHGRGSMTGNYRYRFHDSTGACAGTLELTGEGIVVLDQPGAEEGVAVKQYAAIGVIARGSGVFEGAAGVYAENSAVSIDPPAFSLAHVVQIVDEAGRFRNAP